MKLRKLKRVGILIFLSAFIAPSLMASDDAKWKATTVITLPSTATALGYSPDGTMIAVGDGDGSVTIWETKTGKLLKTLWAHKKQVRRVQFAASAALLVTIGDDMRARLWSTSDWSEKGSIDDVAFSGAISADGKWLAGQDSKQAIWLWDLGTKRKVSALSDPGKGATKMAFSADGKFLATALMKGQVIVVATKETLNLVARGDKKTPVSIQQTGKDQFSFSLGKLEDDDAITHDVAASRTGTLIALGRGWYGQPAFVDIWDVGAMKRIGRFKPEGSGTMASFSFDNKLVAIDGSEKATIWDIATNKKIASLESDGLIQFSPVAMELAVTDGDKLVLYRME